MQEEVEDRSLNLMVSATKIVGSKIIEAAKDLLESLKEEREKAQVPTGKQSIKELIGQNQGVSNIDISKTDLRDFEKYARKYGIDYAITKDSLAHPPKYMVFFKCRDRDAMDAAFSEYTSKALQKGKDRRPSVLKELRKMKEKVAGIPSKIKIRHQELDL